MLLKIECENRKDLLHWSFETVDCIINRCLFFLSVWPCSYQQTLFSFFPYKVKRMQNFDFSLTSPYSITRYVNVIVHFVVGVKKSIIRYLEIGTDKIDFAITTMIKLIIMTFALIRISIVPCIEYAISFTLK